MWATNGHLLLELCRNYLQLRSVFELGAALLTWNGAFFYS
jgi:hypothetical protein